MPRTPPLLRLAAPLLQIGCTCLGVVPSSATPDVFTSPVLALEPTDESWMISIGGTGTYGPRYPGAELYGFSGAPSIGFRRAAEPIEFSAPEDSLDYTLLNTLGFKAGPVVNFRPGRSAGLDRRLAGLDRDPLTVESGGFVEFWPIKDLFRTRVEVRHGLRAHDGFIADLSGDLVERFGLFTLSGGPRFALADAAVTQRQFGVSPEASSRNGIVGRFQARGGVRSLGYGAALSYDWSVKWRTTIFSRYEHLLGDAATSPITKRFGSADQFTVGIGLTYSFPARLLALGQ